MIPNTPFTGPALAACEQFSGLFGPCQAMMRRLCDSAWQDWNYHEQLNDIDRLAQDGLRCQAEWLRLLQGHTTNQASAPLIQLWFTAAEHMVKAQARVWDEWLDQARRLHVRVPTLPIPDLMPATPETAPREAVIPMPLPELIRALTAAQADAPLEEMPTRQRAYG